MIMPSLSGHLKNKSNDQVYETVCNNVAYEYLCHLQEAKIWMESVLKETLPLATELEENLRNGVYLARIGNVIAPDEIPLSKIYDIFQHRYKLFGLQFKHIDNSHYFIQSLATVNFPAVFYPDCVDIYNKRNMPKLIYCIHALSRHLFKLGKAPSIQDLFGKINFNSEELDSTWKDLKKFGDKIPPFKNINLILLNEFDCDKKALHSFLMDIDYAITNKSSEKLLECLLKSPTHLAHVIPENIEEYMVSFRYVKEEKLRAVQNKSIVNGDEPDMYDSVLTELEIQGYLRSTNCDCLWRDIQNCIKSNSTNKLKNIFRKAEVLELKDFRSDNVNIYIEVLKKDSARYILSTKHSTPREILEMIILNGNRLCRERRRVSEALTDIKNSVKSNNAKTLITVLGSPYLNMKSKIRESHTDLYLRALANHLQIQRDLTSDDVQSLVIAVNRTRMKDENSFEEDNESWNLTVETHDPCTVTGNRTGINGNGFVANFNFEKSIVQFQAYVRGYLLRFKLNNKKAASPVQSEASNLNCVRSTNEYSIKRHLKHIDKIIKIQAFWRGYATRKLIAVSGSNSKFIILRQMGVMQTNYCNDYSEELRLQNLRRSLVETIRKDQELSIKLDEMDTKIGLLVQNKILVHSLDFDENPHHNRPNNNDIQRSKGIKTLKKETKALLDGYCQLFYMLQTEPRYLTRLITRLPQKSTHLIQNCILSLFNYGSSTRDTYLLLRLFRSALVEEVNCKFQRPTDAIKGDPVVLRLALAFSRRCEGYNPLKNILGFLIEKVLKEKNPIDINPIEIYRRWINKMETETGRTTDLPLNVTQSQALSHPEVVKQLSCNLKILKMWVKNFLKRITACAYKFPYALRFVASILWKALKERFPGTSEKDINKIVGNLVFYQYINSAIIAPESFYIISLPPDQRLQPEQRKNLASIAKILHFASSKSVFGVESPYLMCLNSFIISCHEEMKIFSKKCSTVEDLEEHFNITKYSEATLIEKPKIYITLKEICECHRILYQERQHISTDFLDPIQDVLDSLGKPPTVANLVGCSAEDVFMSRAGTTQVCLELNNKFQLPPEDPTESEKLFIETKNLIINRLPKLNGTSLKEAVSSEEHSDIRYNLMQLELAGIIKSSDDYNTIVESLICDMTHKSRYQKNLSKEIRILTLALEKLNEKKKYHEDQLIYYEQYLTTCLKSLTKSIKKSNEKNQVINYTASHLREKGILISIDGLPQSQYKHVQFEVAQTEASGIYSITGRFMDFEIDKINIDVQDLLKYQFEGQSVMDIFGKAKLNVNLLLHLLNKKFHT